MIRAEAAAQTGGLDERFNVWEDLEWCLRLSNAWKFRSVPEPLVLRREGKYDQLTDNFVEMRDRTYSLFLEKHRPLAAKYGPSAERALVASLSRILGGEGLDNGHYADARRYLIRSIRYDPWSLTSYLYLLLSLGGRYTYRPANYLKRRLAGAGTADRFDSSEGSH
jgi:GT2 family glycosyltransferase